MRLNPTTLARKLFVACVLMLSACGLGAGQRKNEKPLPPRWDSPPEVTILQHRFGAVRKYVSQTKADPLSPGSEPSSRVTTQVSPGVELRIRNETTKKIVGIAWYFILHKTAKEEYFRVRFVNTSIIEAGKTKTITGEMDRIPRPPQTTRVVSADELDKPLPPPQERIVISCIMFADGSFSSLNEFTKDDCETLKPVEKTKTN